MNRLIVLALLGLTASGCSTWRHVETPADGTVTAGVYEYRIPAGWTYQVANDVLVASHDGPGIQHVQSAFLEWDDPVAGDPERQDLTESMLPADVADQLLAARRRQLGIDAIETTSLAPATVADLEAFRAEYEYRTIDGVRFLGVCYGAMRPAGVYLLQYEAPAIHYFERDLAAFESIVQSMRRLSKEERKARNP